VPGCMKRTKGMRKKKAFQQRGCIGGCARSGGQAKLVKLDLLSKTFSSGETD